MAFGDLRRRLRRVERAAAATRQKRRLFVFQSEDDPPVYKGRGVTYTEAELAALAEAHDITIIRFQYADAWPPGSKPHPEPGVTRISWDDDNR